MNVSDFKNIMWEYTKKISDSMSNAFCPICEQNGLTMMQVRILTDLYKNESHTIGSLADSTGMAGANISAMCKKLEGKGLLERVRDQYDERVVRVALTQKGKEIIFKIDTSLNEKFMNYLEDESEETINEILSGLQKLSIFLDKINED